MPKLDGFQTTDSFRFDRDTSSSSISLSSSSGYGSRLSLSPNDQSSSAHRRPGLTKYFRGKLSRHKSLASLLLFSTPTDPEKISNDDIYDAVWNLDEQIAKLHLAVQKQVPSTIISMSVDAPPTATDRQDDRDLLSAAAWYQEGLSAEICEEYFRHSEQPIGAFLIRSADDHSSSSFVLSIKTYRTSSEHFAIQRMNTKDKTYRIQGSSKTFVNLSTLVIHHTIMRENLPVRLVLPVISSTLKLREQSPALAIIRSVRF